MNEYVHITQLLKSKEIIRNDPSYKDKPDTGLDAKTTSRAEIGAYSKQAATEFAEGGNSPIFDKFMKTSQTAGGKLVRKEFSKQFYQQLKHYPDL